MAKTWFAIQKDSDDDWSTGSFDFDEAVRMAFKYDCPVIAEIDGDYDEEGNPATDPICIAEYRTLDYFTRDNVITALKTAYWQAYDNPGYAYNVFNVEYKCEPGHQDEFLGGFKSINEIMLKGDFEGIADKILSRD